MRDRKLHKQLIRIDLFVNASTKNSYYLKNGRLLFVCLEVVARSTFTVFRVSVYLFYLCICAH